MLKLNSKTTSVPVVNCCCRCSSIRKFGVMLYDYTLCCGLPKLSLYLISCVCGHKQAKLLNGCGLKHVNLENYQEIILTGLQEVLDIFCWYSVKLILILLQTKWSQVAAYGSKLLQKKWYVFFVVCKGHFITRLFQQNTSTAWKYYWIYLWQ